MLLGRVMFCLVLGLAGAARANAPAPDAAGPTPFVVNSTGSTYPFVVEAIGTLERRGDSLFVTVDSGVVASHLPPDLGAEGEGTDVQLLFGLGRRDGSSWQMGQESASQSVAPRLLPGEAQSLSHMRFVLVGLDHVKPAERWLVAQVGAQQHLPGVKAGLLVSYACAEANLSGPTVASQRRAARMRAAYSQTC